jgi:uncharacterized membrane protein
MSIERSLRAAVEKVWREIYRDRPATFWGVVAALIVIYLTLRIGAYIASTNDTMLLSPF